MLSNGTKRVHFYNRIDIATFIPLDLNLPNNLNDIISLLNTVHGCDFNSDDLELVKGDLITKPNSLGYKGFIPSQGTDHVYIANGYVGRIKLSSGQEWINGESNEYSGEFLKQHGIATIQTGDNLMCYNLVRFQNTTDQKIEIEIDNTSSDSDLDGMEVLEPQENTSIEKSVLTDYDNGFWVIPFYRKVKFTLAPNDTFTQEQIAALDNFHNIHREDIEIYDQPNIPHREDVSFDFYLNNELVATSTLMEETDLENAVSLLNTWLGNKGLGLVTGFNAVAYQYRFALGVRYTTDSGFILLKIVARYTSNPNEDQSVFGNYVHAVTIEGNAKVLNVAMYDPLDINNNGTGLG